MKPSAQLSLFEVSAAGPDAGLSSEAVLAGYAQLFERWLAWRVASGKKAYRDTSRAVVADMWTTLTRVLVARGVACAQEATEADLAGAIEQVAGSLRYRKRLLAMLDGALQAAGAAPESSVAHRLLQRDTYRFADTREDERTPVHLNQLQQHALITLLTTRSREGSWQACRDKAIAAVIFGSGAKPGEALALTWAALAFEGLDARRSREVGKLRLTGHATAAEREAPLASWARAVLADWLAVYEDELRLARGPERFVFPAIGRHGQPQDRALSASRYYRQFRELLEAAGIRLEKGGGHVLRHTFAVRQLSERPDALVQIKDWLGLERTESALPYARVVARGVRVV